ncbi:Uncharacterized membrane protein YccC [Pararobbsia alpina]|uniref:FUSC family protein n=1 Tax=Pararobbsia alpina TaxID=621374 RepID=UPI0039A4B25D
MKAPCAPGTAGKPFADLRSALRHAWGDWLESHGGVAIFLFRTVIAALLAMWLAMAFDLSQPRTALATVYVLMQPLNGSVLAKSVCRIIGTLAGAVAAVAFAAVFGQMPEGYLVALALWIAVCTGAASRHRGFRWYGIALAGYTAALIGAPNVMHPEAVFDASLTRTAEVMLGILCSGLASALVFPKQASHALRESILDRHTQFIHLVGDALAQRIAVTELESAQTHLIEQAVEFEASRLPAAFEDPEFRARQGRLARLNLELMRAATRLHALTRLLDRVHTAIDPFLMELAAMLDEHARGVDALRRHDARAPSFGEAEVPHMASLVSGLARLRDALPARVTRARAVLRNTGSEDLVLDFDTAAELLYRLTDELIDYVSTYAALGPRRHIRERHSLEHVFHTHWRVLLTTGLRSGGVVLAVGAFWMATDWPSGPLAMIAAAVTVTLCASVPHPARFAWQLCAGTALAGVVSYVFVTHVYPAIDGFTLLACALSVPFAVAALLTSRPSLAGYGVGLGVFFCVLAGPDNVIQYQPEGLINDALAAFAAVVLNALAFGLVFPPRGRWTASHMQADLRAQVSLASRGRLPGLEARFHSGTRDLTSQLRRALAADATAHGIAMAWSLSVLEVGHAMIHARIELEALCEEEDKDEGTSKGRSEGKRDMRVATMLRSAVGVLFAQIASLFRHPDADRWQAACIYADATIATLRSALDTDLHDRATRHHARKILSELHFIRTALLDASAPWHRHAVVPHDGGAPASTPLERHDV